MNPSEIMKALEMVLTDREFQILMSESTSMLCTRDEKHYRIIVFGTEETDIGTGTEETHILVAPEDIINEKKDLFPKNLLLWPLEDLERELGRIALAEHGIGSDTASTFLDKLLSEGRGAVIKNEPVLSAFVRPVIDDTMARTISDATVKGFNFEMEFIPHYIYVYSAILKEEGGETRRREGELWMNAVSGDFITPLEEAELLPYGELETGKPVEPEIDSDDAIESTREKILDIREGEEDAVKEVPEAMAINRKTFLPVEESLVINFRGTVYLPVWSIEGIHGSIIIDAVKGELVSEIFFEEQEDKAEDEDCESPAHEN